LAAGRAAEGKKGHPLPRRSEREGRNPHLPLERRRKEKKTGEGAIIVTLHGGPPEKEQASPLSLIREKEKGPSL